MLLVSYLSRLQMRVDNVNPLPPSLIQETYRYILGQEAVFTYLILSVERNGLVMILRVEISILDHICEWISFAGLTVAELYPRVLTLAMFGY
jgi:hypothetical protein